MSKLEKKDKKRLIAIQVSEDEFHNLRKKASEMSLESGEFVSVSSVVRQQIVKLLNRDRVI